ncbi:MAG TPA: type II toxin-antitoxin system VapC family toxin [Terriglobales bacterium]|jgi:predicted nucleic-acid-binding protein|nr:type II toxin-antitoxin system VapC family toxin [Terriglobales bacterium]
MIGLDTNILVRYITHDDAAQTAIVMKLMASLSSESLGYVSLVVLVELIWVLEDFFDFSKKEVEDVVESLLRGREILFERPDLVEQAVRKFKSGNADFADCIIERAAHAAGSEYTLTFDRKALSAGMKLAV